MIRLFTIGQKVVTDIPDNEWVRMNVPDKEAPLPKRFNVYHVAAYKEEDGILYIRLRELGQAWYLERGFKAYRSLRENVV